MRSHTPVVAIAISLLATGQVAIRATDPPPKIELAELNAGDVVASKVITLDLEGITSLSLSPSGKVFAVNGRVKPDDSFASHIFDTTTGKRTGATHPGISPGYFSADGKRLAFMEFQIEKGKDHDVVVLDTTTEKLSVVTQIKNALEPFDITPDGKMIVTARGSTLGFFNVPNGKPTFPAVKTDDPILSLSKTFLGGSRIATLHDKGVVRVWDLSNGKETDKFEVKSELKGLSRLSVADDGVAMLVGNEGLGNEIWDLKAKKATTWKRKDPYDRSGIDLFPPMYRAMAGGRLYFTTKEKDVKTKDGKVDELKFVAIVDLQTGGVTHRLLPPEKWDESNLDEIRVSADGTRVMQLNTTTGRLVVWDVPPPKK